MKKDGILDRLLNYELDTAVTFDPKNTAINMAIIVAFVLVAFYGIKLIKKS